MSIATEIVTWVKAQIKTAYDDAIYWIIYYYEKAKDLIDNAKLTVTLFATNTINATKQALTTLISNMVKGVYDFIGYNNKEGLTLLAYVLELINSYVTAAKQSLTNTITLIVSTALGPYNPLLAFLSWLQNNSPLLDTSIITKLRDFANRLYGSLIAFFLDPGGFILTLIWGNFLRYLEWILAVALGTVEAELPPVPQWYNSEGGTGGTNPPPVLPPSPGIVYPCEPLYISGTTFSPGHPGVDFGLTDGQPIFAAHDGVISESRWVDYGFGFTIALTGNPYWTRYGHLKQLIAVQGQQVNAGQLIAYGDSTGNSTGPHLHFEIKVNGVYQDPLTVL